MMMFMLAAVVGGVLLVCQFVNTMLGLGGSDLAGGHDAGHDLAHDLGGDAGHGADVHGHDAHHAHPSSSWLFSLISLRTITAALTFFGLAGLTAESAGWAPSAQLLAGLLAGAAALFVVRGVLRLFVRLNEDGTIRIQRAIGKNGTVYIPIPGGKSGTGKVQVEVLGRLMEFEALTANPAKLATGARVVVTGVVGAGTLEVRPATADRVETTESAA